MRATFLRIFGLAVFGLPVVAALLALLSLAGLAHAFKTAKTVPFAATEPVTTRVPQMAGV